MQMQVHRVQIMTTRLYGVTGSTQEADDPLIRATNVLKTKIECMYSTKHEKEKELPPKNHNWEYIINNQLLIFPLVLAICTQIKFHHICAVCTHQTL